MHKAPVFWHQPNHFLGVLLTPISMLYRYVARLRHRRARPGYKSTLPVIAIGNITAGGAGKTPTCLWLANWLQTRGYHPHILTRGYGATIHAPIRVNPKHHHAAQTGDEALLLARHTPCWAYKIRADSAKQAEEAGADCLIMDDGLQHHSLQKNLEILVIDGPYGLGNGRLIPAGPLRETLKDACTHVHAAIIIGEDTHGLTNALPKEIPCFHADIVPQRAPAWLQSTPVLAFCGIARPEKFFDSLTKAGASIAHIERFADHHPFTKQECDALLKQADALGAQLITTEKDWVRLTPLMQAQCAVLPITLQMKEQNGFSHWLQSHLPPVKPA